VMCNSDSCKNMSIVVSIVGWSQAFEIG